MGATLSNHAKLSMKEPSKPLPPVTITRLSRQKVVLSGQAGDIGFSVDMGCKIARAAGKVEIGGGASGSLHSIDQPESHSSRPIPACSRIRCSKAMPLPPR